MQLTTVRKNKQSGSVLALLLVVTVVICIVGFVISGLVGQVLNQLGDEDIQIEAQMLAGDLKEYTKYLLAYEKIMFVDNPLKMGAARRDNVRELWKETPHQVNYSNTLNVANVCGGYEFAARFLGTLTLDGERVFCPVLLRQSDMTTKDIEDMYFDKWANAKGSALMWKGNQITNESMSQVFESEDGAGNPLPEGHYRIRLNFSEDSAGADDPDWYQDSDNMIPMYVGQKLFELKRDSSINFNVRAEVIIDMFTDSMGFTGKISERFFKVSSIVTIKSPGSATERSFVDSESFILRTPTLKDFSLFIAYPLRSDLAPTTSFREATNFASNTNIRGRVFFNGNMDPTTLASLPTFFDTVFISGSLTTPVRPEELPLFRTKFRRGLITNLSAARFIFDGDCLPDNPPDPNRQLILNGSGIPCKDNGGVRGIESFPGYNAGDCKCYPMAFVPGTGGKLGRYEYQNQQTPGVPCTPTTDRTTCNLSLAEDSGVGDFIAPSQAMQSISEYGFLLGAFKQLNLTSNSSVYGTIIGGHIQATSGGEFYPLTEMKPGLRGIGSAQRLSDLSSKANSLGGGVSAPLPNFPLIQLSKDGFK
jgi:hypothetical protein